MKNRDIALALADKLAELPDDYRESGLVDFLTEALDNLRPYTLADADDIAKAREKYCCEDDEQIMIDDGARASETDDGVWVQCWLWLSRED